MTHNSEDVRVLVIDKIWGYATMIFLVSLPWSAFTSSDVIPVAAIAGATVATIVVWRSPDREDNSLTDSIKNLERRVSDLETICTQEDVPRRIRRWDTED